MARQLLQIPRHAFRLALFAALCSVVVFVALTRTQVGRDGLRSELERQFAATFKGRLEIDRLTGNLVNDLFARDVRIYDARGQLVVRVDSIIARPRWSDFLGQRATFGRLTLIRPEIYLKYDGAWNLGEAFRRVEPRDGKRMPWSFTSADVQVRDGHLLSINNSLRPEYIESGWLFDITNTEADAINLHAIVEWQPDSKLIDVLNASAYLKDVGLHLDVAQGQFVVENSTLALNQVRVELGGSHLRLDGMLSPLANLRQAPHSALIDLTLDDSRLDFDELRRVVPRLPLADTMQIALTVRGQLHDLTIDSLDLRRGNSHLQTTGRVRGLPAALDTELQVRNSTLTASDWHHILPNLPPPVALDAASPFVVNLDATGHLSSLDLSLQETVRVNGTFDVRSAAGHVAGRLGLDRQAGTEPVLTFDLDADSVDAGSWTNDPRWLSRLDGHLTGEMQITSLTRINGSLDMQLRPSHIAGRAIDTLRVRVVGDEGVLTTNLFARRQKAALLADGILNLRGALPVYRLDLTSHRLDLGPLLLIDSLTTQLDGRARLTGIGFTQSHLQGSLELALDSSAVRWGNDSRLLPSSRTTLTLRPPSAEAPRLEIGGDVLSARLEGAAEVQAITALSELWAEAVSDALDRRRIPFIGETTVPSGAPQASVYTGKMDAVTSATGITPFSAHATLVLIRPDVLQAILPGFPTLDPGFRADMQLSADTGTLTLAASIHGAAVQTSGLRADSLHAVLNATASRHAPLEQTLRADLIVDAASLHVGDETLPKPRLTLAFGDGQATFQLAGSRGGLAGPLRVDAAVDLLRDRTRITLNEVYLALGDDVWRTLGKPLTDVYADAIRIPGLTLESEKAIGQPPQRVRLHGSRGRSARDTLFAEIENVSLRKLSDLFGIKRPLGGRVDGRLALTGTDQPELTGRLAVDTLAYDDRLVGRFEFTSRYLPGTPDVALDLKLRPFPADFVTPNGFQIEENALRATGRFRLAAGDDPGELDIAVHAERADAFFFEYIFPTILADVRGSIEGHGIIRGTFRQPIFGGDFTISRGHLDLPRFNLAYDADGKVRIDAEGIQLSGIRLRDETGGTATVTGDIEFNDYRFFSLDLEARLDELQIIDVVDSDDLPFYGRIWASGNAMLTGPISGAFLRANNVTTSPNSELFIPIVEEPGAVDPGFIVFTDSTGQTPNFERLTRRDNVLAMRPAGERSFLDGLAMDLNILAAEGSTVHLVLDPLLGDVINAVGSGRIQLQLNDGEFATFGQFAATSGDYLFTAGEVFVRRFLIEEGSITWDGDPVDARLDLSAAYRTRASKAGLPLDLSERLQPLIPLVVQLQITGRVSTPQVALQLTLDRSNREGFQETPLLETFLNQPERAAEYATSVLLTNSFLLTTDSPQSEALAGAGFNSVSQLVASQVNRYLSYVVPNVDLSLGVQGDAEVQDLDVTAGLALRLLDERLVIRGQGVYRGLGPDDDIATPAQQGLQGEFVVEIRLSPSVSVEVFYRREGDVLAESVLTSTTGAGLSYQTRFASWRGLMDRLFGQEPERSQELPPGADPVIRADPTGE